MNRLKWAVRKVVGLLVGPHLWLLVYIGLFVAFWPSAITPLALILQGFLLLLCFYKLYEIIERRRIRAEEELIRSFSIELDKVKNKGMAKRTRPPELPGIHV